MEEKNRIRGKNAREDGQRFERKVNKYSLANKKRWANSEYKKCVGKAISIRQKGRKSPMEGKHHSKKTKEKIRNSKYHKNLKGTKKGELNYNWKGDDIKYGSLHQYINNNFEKTNKCEICGNQNKKLEWANKDHKYSRKREDWQYICRSCHRKYDNDNKKRKK